MPGVALAPKTMKWRDSSFNFGAYSTVHSIFAEDEPHLPFGVRNLNSSRDRATMFVLSVSGAMSAKTV
jgi:hypothetical protein